METWNGSTWMDEEDKAHVVNGKKGILPFVTTQLDLEDIMLSERSSRKTNTVWSHWYVDSSKAKLVAAESRMAVARGMAKTGWFWSKGTHFYLQDEYVLDI